MVDHLYYEAHITLEPHPDGDVERLRQFIAHRGGWKFSTFEEDEVDNATGKWFLSARSTVEPFLRGNMAGLVRSLRDFGYVVTRAKLEGTLYDTAIQDQYDLIATGNAELDAGVPNRFDPAKRDFKP